MITVVGGDNFAVRMLTMTICQFPASMQLSMRVCLREGPAIAWLEETLRDAEARRNSV